LTLAVGQGDDSLRVSDGLEFLGPDQRGVDLEHIFFKLGKSVESVFPANKITARCSKCGELISRFEGYRHNRIGDKKVYCEPCHQSLGLPLRSDRPLVNHAEGGGDQGT
jgi:hypothetical protein